ncbi:hypothetical protein ACFQ36_05835 [Arthrobacter sp. GCM10027362]|uniref:hypothetical protein n=1 Tax=Arthrobacter sp. GCM10027362 TaxID=3273379 RepID=UPI00363F5660
MKIAPKNRVQRALVAGAGVLALLATAGCSAVNEQATTRHYAASDGIVTSVGPVNLRNVLIVAQDAKSSGRVLGTAVNTSGSPVQLNLSAPSGSASVTIPADGQVKFEDKEHSTTLKAAGAEPGALVPVTIRVNSESSKVQVPVLDASLAEYAPYLESPQPSGSASAEATSEPTETSTSTATHTP